MEYNALLRARLTAVAPQPGGARLTEADRAGAGTVAGRPRPAATDQKQASMRGRTLDDITSSLGLPVRYRASPENQTAQSRSLRGVVNCLLDQGFSPCRLQCSR